MKKNRSQAREPGREYLVFPRVLSPTVKEVGYDTFLTMLDKKEIKQVQVEDNQIIFSDNADPVNYYKTGVFNDPDGGTQACSTPTTCLR